MIFNPKSLKAIKKMLGNDIVDVLQKNEIYKINTKTVLSPDEMKIGLQIVPKTILRWLTSNLVEMLDGENKKIEIPFHANSYVIINKHGADNYSGEVYKDHKKVNDFKHRSIPGVGLILLTSFELYEAKMLEEMVEHFKRPEDEEVREKQHKLDQIIEQKLMLHKLVESVVEQKMSQRDAIERLIRERIQVKLEEPKEEQMQGQSETIEKKSKLKQFLEQKEKKKQETVKLDKSEIACSDCNSVLYKKEEADKIKLCICYGDQMGKSIKLKKSSDGKVKFIFPKHFDVEDVEMLLEDIKNKK
jgi:hypothetical protein